MTKSILHIADTHIAFHLDEEKNKITDISRLNTSGEEYVVDFKESLIEFLKSEEGFKDHDFTLIYSGDVANSAYKAEYDLALEFLNEIVSSLRIDKSQVLIIPGNHDINRDDCKRAIQEDDYTKKAYEYQHEKLAKFKDFYERFFEGKKTFDPEKAIVDTIQLPNEEIQIIGLNSCYQCDNKKGHGYIEPSKLRQELTLLDLEKYSNIGVTHHNPISNWDKHKNSSFFPDNWPIVQKILLKSSISTFLFGHEHTIGGESHGYDKDELAFFGSTSLSKTNVENGFDVFEIQKDTSELRLERHYGHRFNHGNKMDLGGSWVKHDKPPGPFKRTHILKSFDPKKPESIKEELSDFVPELGAQPIIQPIKNSTLESEVFDLVKKVGAFKTGHFHWSETSRAHNWIDIPKILKDRQNLYLIQHALLDLVQTNKLGYQSIVVLGMEGNLISTKLTLRDDLPVAYIPYSYRYDDHNSYEKELRIKPPSKAEGVLIITDVVHDGNTVKKLIQTEKSFFNAFNKINVVSLFYTGTKPYSVSMLNQDSSSVYNYYYVCKIKAEECPYGSEYKTECEIFCKKLDKVYEFYNARNES